MECGVIEKLRNMRSFNFLPSLRYGEAPLPPTRK